MDVQTVALIGASLVLVFLALLVWAMNSRADLTEEVSLLKGELGLAEIQIKELKDDNEKLLESIKVSSGNLIYLTEQSRELMDANRDLNNLVEDTKKSTHVVKRVALEAVNDITALFQVFEDQSVKPTHISDQIKEKYDLRDTITTERFYKAGRL